jgi:hypothetical protein
MDTPSKPSKLKAMDSMTIGIGEPVVYHDLRGSDGKHREIEGYSGMCLLDTGDS